MRIVYDGEGRATLGIRSASGKIIRYRDVAQLVARAAGGGEVASSSLVIPTKFESPRIIIHLDIIAVSVSRPNKKR